jgi:hypothetical protein
LAPPIAVKAGEVTISLLTLVLVMCL